MIDLRDWKFVVKDTMRFKDVGDWDGEKKEIIAWSGLSKKQILETHIHELIEMVLCGLKGVEDKHLIEYDRAHSFAMRVSRKILLSAGIDPVENEKSLVDLVEKVKCN